MGIAWLIRGDSYILAYKAIVAELLNNIYGFIQGFLLLPRLFAASN
jgi:hypothetical protein